MLRIMCDKYDIEDAMPRKSKKSHNDLISQLKDIEEIEHTSDTGFSTCSFLPSSMLKEQDEIINKKKKKKDNEFYDESDSDMWFDELMEFSGLKAKKTKINVLSKY